MGNVRVNVYVPPEMDDELDGLDESKSAFLREAARKELERRRQNGDEQ
jgi:metal-responsive CopG/Arc/MetJ family transcriptional regulator